MNKTAIQILQTSRILFNEKGVESVAIAQIADRLGISTGNLTYHFARKQHLISCHIHQLELEIVAVLDGFSSDASASEFLDVYASIYSVTWEYRYLFTGTAYLLQNSLLEKVEYQTLVEHIHTRFLAQLDSMAHVGRIKQELSKFDKRNLVDCAWWQWLGWLGTHQFLPDDNKKNITPLLLDGLRHQIFLIQPYLDQRYRDQVLEELERFLF